MASVTGPLPAAADYFTPTLREKHNITDDSFMNIAPTGAAPAEIGWVPEITTYKNWMKLQFESETTQDSIPSGWPKTVSGPLSWSGSNLCEREYIIELSAANREEIMQAVDGFKKTGLELEKVNKSNFPLPQLGCLLKKVSYDVHQGLGFAVIRGLEPRSLSREDNVILYLGLSSYIGQERGRQNLDGSMMTHITDLNKAGMPAWERRPIYSNLKQPFHTDVICHVLGLYYLSAATSGGETYLAPSWTVYNELAANRPDMIKTLAKNDWTHDTFGLNPPCYQRALLHLADGKPIINFSRRILTGAPMTPRTANIPPISDTQAEVLDTLHFCAHKHAIKLRLKAGDICFVNNFAVMHSRAAFKDDISDDANAAKRYVLRLWLNNPDEGWKIPAGLQLAWDRIFAPVPEIQNYFDIDPFADEEKMKEHAGPKGGGGSGGTGRSSDCG